MTQPPHDPFPRYAERPAGPSYGERPAEPSSGERSAEPAYGERPADSRETTSWQAPGSTAGGNLAAYGQGVGAAGYPQGRGAAGYGQGLATGGPYPGAYGYGFGLGGGPVVHTNGLAIAALVLGLIGLLFWPIGPVSAVLGVVALVGIKRRRERGTGMAVAGLTLGAVQTALTGLIVIAALDGAFDEPEPLPAPPPVTTSAKEETFIGDLTVGTCFDELDPDSGGDVYVMFCNEPHDGEITAVVKLTARAYPGDRAVQDEAEKSCDREFERYVGTSVYKTSLEPNFFYPDRTSWEHGDREVSCVAMGPDGDKLDSSVQGSKR